MEKHKKIRRRRIYISISERTLLTKKRSLVASLWCRECAERVSLVRPDLAAIIASVSVRTLYKWIEAGKLHYSEDIPGVPLICLKSLGSQPDWSEPGERYVRNITGEYEAITA